MATYDNIWMVRIGGMGDFTTGEPYLYTTRPCTRSGYIVVPSMVREVSISPSSMELFESIALNRSANLELLNLASDGAFATGIAALLRRDAAPVRVDGAAVRLTAFASAATTTFSVTDSAPFTVNRWYSLGSEVFRVTAKPTSTTLTVTRGQMGTRAEPHYAVGLGPVFLDRSVDVVGRRVVVEVASWNGTTLGTPRTIFTGVARKPTDSGTRVRIEVEGPLNPMMQRKWLPPQCYRAESGAGLGATCQVRFYTEPGYDIGEGRCIGIRSSRWAMSRLAHGALGLEYIRYVNEDGKWVVTACTAVADADAEASGFDLTTDDVYESGATVAETIIAAGEGMEPIALSRFDEPGAWLSWTGGSEWDEVKAEYVDVSTTPVYVGDYVYGLMADTTRPLGVGIQSDQVNADVAERLNDAMPYPLIAQHAALGVWVAPRFDSGTSFREVIRAYVDPTHCSLVSGRDGTVRVVDPVALTVAEDTIEGVDERGGGMPTHGFSRDTVLRSLNYTTRIGNDTTNTTIFSDVAQSLYAGGRDVAIETVIYAAHHDSLRQRAISILRTFERSRPEVNGIVTDETDELGNLRTVDVGGVITPDHPKVIGLDGQRGTASELRALVLECARTNMRLAWRLLLLDAGRGFLWSPVAVVASKAAGVITTTTAAYSGTTDASYFKVGDEVILRDEFGAVKVATPTAITAVLGATFSIDAGSAVYTNAVGGDRVILANYDDAFDFYNWGWWADSAGTLGVTPDDGYIWA